MDDRRETHIVDRRITTINELSEVHSLLARIDERTNALDKRLEHVDKRLEEYITRHEFTPVKLLAYGFAGIVLMSVVTSLIATVLVS